MPQASSGDGSRSRIFYSNLTKRLRAIARKAVSETKLNIGADPDDLAQDAAEVAWRFLVSETPDEQPISVQHLAALEAQATRVAVTALRNDYYDHLRKAAVRTAYARDYPSFGWNPPSQEATLIAKQAASFILTKSANHPRHNLIAKAAVSLAGETMAKDIAEKSGETNASISEWRAHMREAMGELMKKK